MSNSNAATISAQLETLCKQCIARRQKNLIFKLKNNLKILLILTHHFLH